MPKTTGLQKGGVRVGDEVMRISFHKCGCR